MTTLGTPLSPSATKVMLLGSGELGKEVLIALQRLGVETVVVDRYANAPAQQVAHRAHVIDMTDARALRVLVEREKPHLIVPEIEAIATDTLVAIEAAGLQDALTAQGPVTIFAPTDAAFAKLPPEQLEALLKPENKDKLVQILTNHVVPGKALTADQMKRQRGTATMGEQVKFELVRGRLRVNDARVTGDFDASNGSVIAVDQVLIPN
jgi:uncharacterized surface protein with fasciclin (FAS1) repeats